MKERQFSSTRVTKCEDGVYRWIYTVHLWKNPTYFFLIWRIFFFIFLGIFAVVNLSDAIKWGWEKAAGNLPILGYVLLGMTAITVLGYCIYAAVMGGRYVVEFTMDEKGVLHRQIDWQAAKAQKIAQVTAAAGALSGNLATVGIGMNAARTEMYSAFNKVRRVKACPCRGLIKVNEQLGHNQVYVLPEDFAFVHDYIVSRCPTAKRK